MLENEIIGRLLYQPDALHKIELDPRWVLLSKNRELIAALIENDGKPIDITLMAEQLRDKNPHTEIDENYLENMRADGFGVDAVEEKAKALKYSHYKMRLEKASKRFVDTPSQENMLAMQDRMMELEKLSQPDDDGNLKSTIEDIYRELEEGAEEGIKTYNGLDDTLGGGLGGGMLVTIAADTGFGKTAYSINLACQAIARNEEPLIDFFTLEMNKKQMTKRFISRLSEVNSYKLRNPKLALSAKEKALVVAKSQELLDTHLRVFDDMFRISEVVKQIRRGHYKAKGRPYIAFIDYVQLVESGNTNEPRHLQIGSITRALKLLTNELDIPIVLISQLRRKGDYKEKRKPGLSDLSDSSSIEKDSNVVILLSEDADDSSVTIVDIAKNREGYTGEIKYRFLKSKMYFQEVG